MTDAFESYGETAASRIPDNRANRRAKKPSKLDLKMEEKQRLSKAYLASQRARRAALLEQEPRLRNLVRYLRKIGPEDGDEVVAAFAACDWLAQSSADIKIFALELLTRAESRIKLAQGLLPLDDPAPGETSVYFEVQREMRKGGLR